MAGRFSTVPALQFRKDVVKVAENVYTFAGHSVQPVSMIIGTDGLIIVDTGLDTKSAQGVLAEMRRIRDLPVKAIILTHGHGDPTGGLPVFAAERSPDIWARDHLIALDPAAAKPKQMKAEALEGLAENLLTATGRNYYLTCAQELRNSAGE